MAILTLHVTGMHCASCGMLIDESLEELPGVASSQTDVANERTVVDHDPVVAPPDSVATAIAELGYEAKRADP
ncbi:MAG: heavy-metal-associated domain-containing protein [Actinomycetota bacterium]|jgi:copper chaperone|nr:heavy-metal-associated domain-containing protein [Actinomycetota bacterium]